MGDTLKYVIANADKIKELSNSFLGFFMSIGLLVAIGAIVWYLVKHSKDTAKTTSEALNSVKDAVNSLKEAFVVQNSAMLSMQEEIKETKKMITDHHNALLNHTGATSIVDERTKSVKEICADTNNKVDDIHRRMATTEHITGLQKEVTDMGKHVAVAVARMEG